MFGRNFCNTGVQNELRKKAFEELMSRSFAALGAVIVSDFIPFLSFLPELHGWASKIQAVRALGVDIISKMIQVDKHREQAKGLEKDAEYLPDFVDVLLKAPLDGDLLAEKDIVTLIVCMMNGGTDTSALTVEWGMAELMENPNLQKQAQAEIDVVVGQDRLVQESDLANLPFLRVIVKETYRMHPSLPRRDHLCLVALLQFAIIAHEESMEQDQRICSQLH